MSICKLCGKAYTKTAGNQKYCSNDCRYEAIKKQSRITMRQARNRLRYTNWYSCQVCGYDKVVDLHHEGHLIYALCPNHHALITRNKCRIEEYGIDPIEKEAIK